MLDDRDDYATVPERAWRLQKLVLLRKSKEVDRVPGGMSSKYRVLRCLVLDKKIVGMKFKKSKVISSKFMH